MCKRPLSSLVPLSGMRDLPAGMVLRLPAGFSFQWDRPPGLSLGSLLRELDRTNHPTVAGMVPSFASYSILIRRGLCGPQVKSMAAWSLIAMEPGSGRANDRTFAPTPIRMRIFPPIQSICFSVPSATGNSARPPDGRDSELVANQACQPRHGCYLYHTREVPTRTDSGTSSIRSASVADASGFGKGFPSSNRSSARSIHGAGDHQPGIRQIETLTDRFPGSRGPLQPPFHLVHAESGMPLGSGACVHSTASYCTRSSGLARAPSDAF